MNFAKHHFGCSFIRRIVTEMLELKSVSEIVEENHSTAYILDCYGIEFYKCSDKLLGDICLKKGIDAQNLSHNLVAGSDKAPFDLRLLESYPADLVVEYLKHAHHIFLKKSLPFMRKLIEKLDETKYEFPDLIKDLKFVFPLFIEDFIHHIYEEEDGLFEYVNDLRKVQKGEIPQTKIFTRLEEICLEDLYHHHEDADDEMRGIRRITNNYTRGINTDLHLRTIYRELKDFEKELVFHANVENEILFPKALELEREVRNNYKKTSFLN